jgi:hypothetical protein
LHLLLGDLRVGLHGIRDDRSLDYIVSVVLVYQRWVARTLLASTQSSGIVLSSNVVVGVVVVEHRDLFGSCSSGSTSR